MHPPVPTFESPQPPPAAAVPAPWPRPRVSPAACLESGGVWLLIWLAGSVLILALILGLQREAVQDMRDVRLQIDLHDIKERLEADLALGFALGDSAHAQALLEEALAQDASLVSAEVFDLQGVSLFNTDRGSIGESVPDAWRAATAKSVGQGVRQPSERALRWSSSVGGDATVGVAVLGPFGETTGYVSLTSASAARPRVSGLLAVAGMLAMVLGALACAVVSRTLAARRELRDAQAMDQAWQRLQACQGRLQETLTRLGEAGQTSA